MTAAYFEDHPTDPNRVILRKPTMMWEGSLHVICQCDKCKAQPQRTWAGLTDEEVESYWDWEDFQCGCGRGTLLDMVRDIESRLKERNT